MLTEKRLYAGVLAYAAIGLVFFGHASQDSYIEAGCPTEPGWERGICYEANAYVAALKGIVWPVYYPAALLIEAGRQFPAGHRALKEKQG